MYELQERFSLGTYSSGQFLHCVLITKNDAEQKLKQLQKENISEQV